MTSVFMLEQKFPIVGQVGAHFELFCMALKLMILFILDESVECFLDPSIDCLLRKNSENSENDEPK